MNNPIHRTILGATILATGLLGQVALEAATATTRPLLRQPLATLPSRLGDWEGRDLPVADDVLREAQADDCLSRVYEDRRQPGRRVTLWLNYSTTGLNLRHSPEKCLPSAGWTKVEAQCRVVPLGEENSAPLRMSRLAYAKAEGELVQRIGFWYYIFGEGAVERYVRSLPITSKSSHGRATRGSGLTVEVFAPLAGDADGNDLRDFAEVLLPGLDPILPAERAPYHIP